jgi:hypothetical protein
VLLSQSEGSPNLYAATPSTADAVNTLVASRAGASDDAAAMAAGDGTWEVFYAPHMRTSELLSARFRPVRYVLSQRGTRMRSDVGYALPGGAAGWLSAEGSVAARGDGGVDVLFETFWVEGVDASAGDGGALPPPRVDNPLTGGGAVSPLEAAVNAVGQAVRAPAWHAATVAHLTTKPRLRDAGRCTACAPRHRGRASCPACRASRCAT